MTENLDVVENNVGCICVRRSTSDEVDHNFRDMELEQAALKVGKWCGNEVLPYLMGIDPLV